MISQSYTAALPPGPQRLALTPWATAPTREEWLTRLADALRPVFAALDVQCPCSKRKPKTDCPYCHGTGKMATNIPRHIRVACSWPSSKRAIGECWHPRCSGDGRYEIMISYAHERPVDAAGTLVHELVHTVVGLAAKHGKFFKAVALAIGLEGKMTSGGPGQALIERLHALAAAHCGGYPGAPLGRRYRYDGPVGGPDGGSGGGKDKGGPDSSGPKAQVCRQVLIACTECGVKLRGARGIGKGKDDQPTGIRALLPSPAATFNCPCGGEFRPDKGEQVWPEVNYLLAFLALAGTPGLEWRASSK
jgi:hypothetical protein